jgi:hypothetical protein
VADAAGRDVQVTVDVDVAVGVCVGVLVARWFFPPGMSSMAVNPTQISMARGIRNAKLFFMGSPFKKSHKLRIWCYALK